MEKKYWLHRISHNWEVSYALFEKGYLSLGWSAFSKTNILDAARKSETEFEMLYKKYGKDKNRSRWNMWYFAQFNEGDIIVVPLFNGEFSICEVIERAKPIFDIEKEVGNFTDCTGETIRWENDLLIRGSKKKCSCTVKKQATENNR